MALKQKVFNQSINQTYFSNGGCLDYNWYLVRIWTETSFPSFVFSRMQKCLINGGWWSIPSLLSFFLFILPPSHFHANFAISVILKHLASEMEVWGVKGEHRLYLKGKCVSVLTRPGGEGLGCPAWCHTEGTSHAVICMLSLSSLISPQACAKSDFMKDV